MSETINIVEPIFYHTLEYVFAPIGLLVITYYVKGEKDGKHNLPRRLGDNTEENLLIVSYSCLLFFLHLCAEPHPNCGCVNEQCTSLILAVTGLFLIIFYKNPISQQFSLVKKSFKWSWMVMLCVLLFLVISTNMKYHGFNWSEKAIASDFNDRLIDTIHLFKNPMNVVFALFVFLILWFVIMAQDNSLRTTIDSSQSRAIRVEQLSFFDRWKLKRIAKNKKISFEARISAYFTLAEHFYLTQNYKLAKLNIINAKDIAIMADLREDRLQPIRRLIIRIHAALNEVIPIRTEFTIVKNIKPVQGEFEQSDLDLWLSKMKAILSEYPNINID